MAVVEMTGLNEAESYLIRFDAAIRRENPRLWRAKLPHAGGWIIAAR